MLRTITTDGVIHTEKMAIGTLSEKFFLGSVTRCWHAALQCSVHRLKAGVVDSNQA